MTDKPKNSGQRRWYQFSLRTLFVVVTLVAVLLSLLTRPLMDSRRERALLESIGPANVSVNYEYVRVFGSNFCSTVLGTGIYRRVWRVKFEAMPPKDFDLARLAELPRLRELSLEKMPLDDDRLTGLSKLDGLESLDLSDTLATDDTLTHLEGLKKLEHLGTLGTKVTYAALERLQSQLPTNAEDLCNLRAFDELRRLGNCVEPGWKSGRYQEISNLRLRREFQDADVKHLAYLRGLRKLHLCELTTDKSMRLLQHVEQLEKLGLHSTKVNGEGLQHLAGLNRLKILSLANVQFNDAGLRYLAELKQLEELTLLDVEIAEDALERLRVALPKTQIEVLHETTQSASEP